MKKTLKNKDKNLKLTTLGFTLIELLAVIVILGLLALIVTPGVAKVIRNSKINTSKSSLEGYIREVENASALYMTDNGVYPTNINQLEIDGKNVDKIENVNVTFEHGEITKVTAEINGLYCIYEEKIGSICDEDNFNVNVNLSTLNIGDAVYYNPVADIYCSAKEDGNNDIYYVENNSTSGTTEGCLKWYVLSKNADGTVNLILDHNIGSAVKWYDEDTSQAAAISTNPIMPMAMIQMKGDNSKGPITVLNELNNTIGAKWNANLVRTDSYTHTFNNGTEDITYNVSYNGMKARLPEAGEIANAVGYTTWNEKEATISDAFYFDSKSDTRTVGYDKDVKISTYAWLFNNLNQNSNSTDASNSSTCLYYGCTKNLSDTTRKDYGYWTSTSIVGNSSNVWSVTLYGDLRENITSALIAIRPVITLN